MKKNISIILQILSKKYAIKKIRPHGDGISELILTILSQNTADRNSGIAFARLMNKFNSWENVSNANTQTIKEQIKIGGMSNLKSKRIKKVLQIIKKNNESYDLSFLKKMNREESLAWLTSLPGVGSKTASCVLLFAYGIQSIPVDTHVGRIVKRIGLVETNLAADDVQIALELLLQKKSYGIFHLNLIEHGRKICHAKKPLCNECVINQFCKKIK
jgi:endonuclease-3